MLANTLATLDLLSDGRVIFGAGIGGVPQEFGAFGAPEDAKARAAMLDEGLELLDRLWSGDRITHSGTHYTVHDVALAPLPAQRPRIPIWIGGESKPALRRAARWDGWIAGGVTQEGAMSKTPEQVADLVTYIREHRDSTTPFEVALTGYSRPDERALTESYAAAGVTWWAESLHGFRGSFEQLLERVNAGPPS
jgi:alkanesulfonate monooxygenase SsuD/methylene tetrahydromethanopterin reductase-like flavin-dependent oxidoreductase (luciferase family)